MTTVVHWSFGNVLIAKRWWWWERDVLDKLCVALQHHLHVAPADITWTRLGLRQAVLVRFPSGEAAHSAEMWIDREFTS